MRLSHAFAFAFVVALALSTTARANWLLLADAETAPPAPAASVEAAIQPAGWRFAVVEPAPAAPPPATVSVREVREVLEPVVIRSSPVSCGPSGCRVQYRVVRSR